MFGLHPVPGSIAVLLMVDSYNCTFPPALQRDASVQWQYHDSVATSEDAHLGVNEWVNYLATGLSPTIIIIMIMPPSPQWSTTDGLLINFGPIQQVCAPFQPAIEPDSTCNHIVSTYFCRSSSFRCYKVYDRVTCAVSSRVRTNLIFACNHQNAWMRELKNVSL